MGSLNCAACDSELGHADPIDKSQLGPRKKRERVREQIRDYILHMLGAPTIQLELDEQNIDFCIDQSLMIVENYAPRDYFQFYTFHTTPGQSIYKMPPEIGFIRNVYYKEQGNFAFTGSELGGTVPLEYFYGGGSFSSGNVAMNPIHPVWGQMGEWVLYKQYEQMYARVSSNLGGWQFLGGHGTVKLYPVPYKMERVIVEYIQKCKDWERVTQEMQEGALTYAKEILGRIRGRIKNPPGPNGGVQLDGDQLIQEAREDRKQWMEDLIYKFGDILPITLD